MRTKWIMRTKKLKPNRARTWREEDALLLLANLGWGVRRLDAGL
jgi:hypothetical protein